MTLLHITPAVDICIFYTIAVFLFWALPTSFFTDFWRKDYWKSNVNRFFNGSMAIFFFLEFAILIYEHLRLP